MFLMFCVVWQSHVLLESNGVSEDLVLKQIEVFEVLVC